MVKQQTKTIWELRQEQIEHNIDFGYYVDKDYLIAERGSEK